MLENVRAGIALLLGRKAPLMVTHHITFRCNLDCAMCGLKLMPPLPEMETAACKDLQKEFRRHGTVVWGYSGGEPLLREDLDELCASAKDLGMRTTLNTNGVLLPQRLDLVRLLDVLEIGIDGGKESHEALRGSGTFDKTVAGLEAVARLAHNRPGIVIQTILNHQSIHPDQLDAMLCLADEYDAKLSFNLAAAHRSDDRLVNARQYSPSVAQFEVFREWLEREKSGPRAGRLFDPPGFFRALGAFPDAPHRISCQAGRRRCVVDPTGMVMPCADQFDLPERLLSKGKRFGYGYAGFKSLPKRYPCGQQYCYTAKINYFLGRPGLILECFANRLGMPERRQKED